MNEDSCCIPSEPNTRIMEINGKLKALGSDVVHTLRAVMKKREQYYGVIQECTEAECSPKGMVNEIDWMIEDIRKMVADIREYVETL